MRKLPAAEPRRARRHARHELPGTAFDLIRRFADDIPAADLKPSIDKDHTRANGLRKS